MSIRLDFDGSKSWKATIDFEDLHSRRCVKRAGFQWDRNRKVWRTSNGAAAASVLNAVDPDALDIDGDVADALSEIAAKAAEAKDALLNASRATNADIEIPSPSGLTYLPYQRAGIAFLRDRFDGGAKGVLLADEMGLGKTIQVIGYMNLVLSDPICNRIKTLIIAPKIALLNWRAELHKWLIKAHSTAIWTTKDQPDADIIIVNYDIVAKLKAKLANQVETWDLLTCDESHALKEGKSQRTKAVLGGGKETAIPAHKRIFATGTPILNRPIELFPILNACKMDFATDFYRYARQYCDGHNTRFGFDSSGASNLSELQEKMRSTLMVRRLKKDVLKELPSKRRQVITVDPRDSAALKKALKDEADGVKKTEAAEKTAEAAVSALKDCGDKAAYDEAVKRLSSIRASNFAVIAELRKQTALAKTPIVTVAVTEMLASVSDAVIVFAHHRVVIDELANGFRKEGYDPAIIHGDTSMEDRQKAQEDIQQGRKRVLIGSILACGVAITLTAASTVIFVELDWTPGRMVQAEDRAHRIGQTNSVLVQYHVVDGSIDAQMLQSSWEKAFNTGKALDERDERANSRSAIEAPPLSEDYDGICATG